MTKAVDSAKGIGRELGSTVVLIHHLGKDASRGARGHSSLFGALDTELTVESCAGGFKMKPTKQRDLEIGREDFYRLERVDLGRDSDGGPMTSCVVVPANGPLGPDVPKLSESAQLVESCFEELLGHSGEEVSATVLQGKYGSSYTQHGETRGVRRKLVLERFAASRQEDPDKPDIKADSSRRAFQRGLKQLQGANLLESYSGYVWRRTGTL
jgi:hypothetical protein